MELLIHKHEFLKLSYTDVRNRKTNLAVETYHFQWHVAQTITIHFLPKSLCHRRRRRHDYYL